MTLNGWLQITFFLGLIFAVTKPLGTFMTKVFAGERTFLDPLLRPVERFLYRVTGVDERHEMRWTEYATSMLLFSAVSMLVLYAIQRIQGMLAIQSATLRQRNSSASCLQHGGVLYDEHQLASLLWRSHHELFHADGGISPTQFHLSCRRHRVGDRVYPRYCSTPDADARQLLGRLRALLSVGVAAILHCRSAVPGVARCCTKSEALRHRKTCRAATDSTYRRGRKSRGRRQRQSCDGQQ